MRLNILKAPPPNLFDTPANGLARLLGGPTLLHLSGAEPTPLFVSVLLHGNEHSGWHAVCDVFKQLEALPRSLLLFIGNVDAAQAGVRTLPDQTDYNRVWRGHVGPEREWADELLDYVATESPFAAFDVHNNTGRNPHYSVLTNLEPASKGLAGLFSDKAVYIEEPDTVLSRALQNMCPSIAVEVGPIDDQASDARTLELLLAALCLENIPDDPGDALKLHQAVARVHVPDHVRFDFVGELPPQATATDDLLITGGIEAVNFHEIDAGFEFGYSRVPLPQALRVLDPAHNDVTSDYLHLSNGHVQLRQPVIPAMFTTDRQVIRQDCLCYFMQRLTTG